MSNHIQTFCGQWLDPLAGGPLAAPQLEDIGHALSHICRFNGHVKRFWSVAHHSLALYYCAPEEARRHCLFHDAAEAYLGDWPTPVKHRLPVVIEAEKLLQARLYSTFRVTPHPMTKDMDDSICEVERLMLCRGGSVMDPWRFCDQIAWLQFVGPQGTKELFIRAEEESRP